jgi:hypothetical protein
MRLLAHFRVPGRPQVPPWSGKKDPLMKQYKRFVNRVRRIAKKKIKTLLEGEDHGFTVRVDFHITDFPGRSEIDNLLKPVFDGLFPQWKKRQWQLATALQINKIEDKKEFTETWLFIEK